MKRLLLVVLLAAGCATSPASEPVDERYYTATTVISVTDGDTIRVRVNAVPPETRVRLIGVDAPETRHPSVPVECFGPEASAFARFTLKGRDVTLEWDADHEDRYDRLLAYVWTGDPKGDPRTEMFNARLVAEGYATPLMVAPNDRYAALFDELAWEAQREGRGLWGACPNTETGRG